MKYFIVITIIVLICFAYSTFSEICENEDKLNKS